MEKKTIGGFIAALRKANGMTQKDLAERLNVSDKTVSRWERDDGSPDLSMIPVIAEIFGITCDELLRGERKSPADRAELPVENESTPKGEKQRQRILKSTLSQYRTYTYIAMEISAVGMIAALICNLAFLKAVLGFLIGAIFFVGSIVCQAVFLNRAFLSVEDAGLDAADLSQFKHSAILLAQKSIGLTVAFIGFTFPLILMDAYVGLSADNMLIFGLIGAAVFLGLYAVILFYVNGSLVKKGVYSFDENQAQIYRHNRSLKKKCAIGFISALVITLAVHAFGIEMIWSARNLASGTTFHDYESFVEYMEQDIPYGSESYRIDLFTSAQESAAVPESQIESAAENPIWYDSNGNEISEQEALTRTLEDKNGKIVCTYLKRNESVVSMRYSAKDGTVLPITVFTEGEYRSANALSGIITTAYCILYPIELLAVILIYFRKRAI